MDNDAKMIKLFSNALINIQVKYRNSKIEDRMLIKPTLEDLINDFSKYQIKLIREGTITTDQDLAEMDDIKAEIDIAANKQELILAIGRTIGFIVTKVV